MDNTNYREYLKNRKWSDATIPQGIDILANSFNIDLNTDDYTIEETNFYEDTKLSADLKMTINGCPYMIGYRSRKKKYIAKYPFDVTLRYINKGGHKTEFAKIMDGCGDFNLYTFTDNDKIVRWILINLHAFRSCHEFIAEDNRWIPKEYIKSVVQSNAYVNDTDFMAYDMLSVYRHDMLLPPEERVIISHSAGYFKDVKIKTLPSSTSKMIEFYELKKQEDRIDGY